MNNRFERFARFAESQIKPRFEAIVEMVSKSQSERREPTASAEAKELSPEEQILKEFGDAVAHEYRRNEAKPLVEAATELYEADPPPDFAKTVAIAEHLDDDLIKNALKGRGDPDREGPVAPVYSKLREWHIAVETVREGAAEAARAAMESAVEANGPAGEWLKSGKGSLIRRGANEQLDVKTIQKALFDSIRSDTREPSNDGADKHTRELREKLEEAASETLPMARGSESPKLIENIASASFDFMRNHTVGNGGGAVSRGSLFEKFAETARSFVENDPPGGEAQQTLRQQRQDIESTCAELDNGFETARAFLSGERRSRIETEGLKAAYSKALSALDDLKPAAQETGEDNAAARHADIDALRHKLKQSYETAAEKIAEELGALVAKKFGIFPKGADHV